MDLKSSGILKELKKNPQILKGSAYGLERECLRVDKKGDLSKTLHPEKLDSALTNKFITTDFSEAQLELVTPPCSTIRGALGSLEKIHTFIYKNLGSEFLWPFSMPCRLPNDKNIPLAQYGSSDQGIKKYIYRKGLTVRYGSKMQTISGIHFNFSFSDKFWNLLYTSRSRGVREHLGSTPSKQEFISESYFHIIRNFLRYRCLISYFFGASPIIDKSYLNKKPKHYLQNFTKDTYLAPQSTSLRGSFLGYNSKVQKQLFIRYDNLHAYIEDLKCAISTPHSLYTKLGIYKSGEQIQLNDNLLQIEAEHYSAIRPKQPPQTNESALQALEKRGVKYIEIRALDIDPFSPIGVSDESLLFIEMLLYYCLLEKSPKITQGEAKEIMAHQNKIALFGGKQPCREIGIRVLKKLDPIANILDQNFKDKRYSNNLQQQFKKISNPFLIPSRQLIANMEKSNKSFLEYGMGIASENKNIFSKNSLTKNEDQEFKEEVEKSLHRQIDLEIRSELYTKGYEDMEGSTQMIIKEALKRKVKVDVIDRKANLIKLTKKGSTHYLQQATHSAKDTMIAYFLLENKGATKKILSKENIRVPIGKEYSDLKGALADYHLYSKKKIVVKPNSTNYGISINFIDPNNPKAYELALKECFRHDKTVIAEEFISGKEYRFLVIGGKVVSVINRRPASVLGDGKHTIEELIDLKNSDPLAYKNNTGYIIRKGKTEKVFLKSQKLTFKSIPKKGKRIFLRENSNIHSGGDPLEVSEKMDITYKKIALAAAQAIPAKICGVDMIVKNPHIKANSRNHAIIELNFNPATQMHKFVVEGKGKSIEKDILNLLGF